MQPQGQGLGRRSDGAADAATDQQADVTVTVADDGTTDDAAARTAAADAPEPEADRDREVAQQAAAADGPPGLTAQGLRIGGREVRWTALAVGVLALVVVGILGWNWFASTRPADPGPEVTTGPAVYSQEQLSGLSVELGHSVYWAGARKGVQYDVTRKGRDISLQYVPDGQSPGNTSVLTVATYEKNDAYAGLQAAAKTSGAVSQTLPGGALVVQPAGRATSAYFAFQGHYLLMEVFDPTPGAALKIVQSGVVQPIP